MSNRDTNGGIDATRTTRGPRNDRLEAEEKSGKYLLSAESNMIGYTVKSATDQVHVENVSINGSYIGTSDYFETECDDYEINGETFVFKYD